MGDNVNHPDHYQNIAGVEAIDILNDVVKDLPGKQSAMLWNTLKYLLRFQKKNGVEDLKKARNYLQWLIDDIDSSKDLQENTNPEKRRTNQSMTSYDFEKAAKNAVIDVLGDDIVINQLDMVWFAHELGYKKCTIWGEPMGSKYAEVTYNRDKDEMYVDIYEKISNTKIPSSEFNFIA